MQTEQTPPPVSIPDQPTASAGDRVGEISQALATALGGLRSISITPESADKAKIELEDIRRALAFVVRGEMDGLEQPTQTILSSLPHEIVEVAVAASSAPGETTPQIVQVAVQAPDKPVVSESFTPIQRPSGVAQRIETLWDVGETQLVLMV